MDTAQQTVIQELMPYHTGQNPVSWQLIREFQPLRANRPCHRPGTYMTEPMSDFKMQFYPTLFLKDFVIK